MLPCNVQYRTSTKIDNENALSKKKKKFNKETKLVQKY